MKIEKDVNIIFYIKEESGKYEIYSDIKHILKTCSTNLESLNYIESLCSHFKCNQYCITRSEEEYQYFIETGKYKVVY